MMPVKVYLAIFVAPSLVCLDSARVWLSCQAIIGISVLVGLGSHIHCCITVKLFD